MYLCALLCFQYIPSPYSNLKKYYIKIYKIHSHRPIEGNPKPIIYFIDQICWQEPCRHN